MWLSQRSAEAAELLALEHRSFYQPALLALLAAGSIASTVLMLVGQA